MKIEILDLTPKSPEVAAETARAEAEADPSLTPAQREAKGREAALDTALELWHSQTLNEYNYNIAVLLPPDPVVTSKTSKDGAPPWAGGPAVC
jgi:hypothetical protein